MLNKSLFFLLGVACLPAQQVVNGGRTVLGRWDASSAVSTKPNKSGSTLPATCSPGETYFKTNATPGQNLYFCTAANTWTQMSGGGGSNITAAPAALWPFGLSENNIGTTPLGFGNQVFLMPFTVTAPMQIGRINLRITTAGPAGTKGVWGIYDAACGALLATTGEITTSWETTGSKSHTFVAPATLSAGAYYLAMTASNATTQFLSLSYGSINQDLFNADAVAGSSFGYGAAAGGSPLALPASCGTITESAGQVPVVVLKP